MKEHKLIEHIRRKCPMNESVILGIDDDTSVIRPTRTEGLVCCDMIMEGVHFTLDTASPEQIGRKALGVNLSDIAAMGGVALSAYVSLALPRHRIDENFIDRLYSGMNQLASTFSVAIAGGDTNIWEGPLVINVTVFGEAHAKQGPILRSGAKPGDYLFVTGGLGGSLAGHHLDFVPRLKEAETLLGVLKPSSMMDISDGLGKDLREIARLSSVRIVLDPASIPLNESIAKEPNAIDRALSDGEDFELCFTVEAKDRELMRTHPLLKTFPCIGRIEAGEGLVWSTGEPVLQHGYQHGVNR